jgi:putative addiction module component (TIGR02574 family)
MATFPNNISSLSAAEKFELLDALWEDLEAHSSALSAGHAEELDRRIAAYEKNPTYRDTVGAGEGPGCRSDEFAGYLV